MIPYTGFSTIYIGPIPLRVWGLCAALGLLVGLWVAKWFAKKQKVDVEKVFDLGFWLVIGGFIGARLGHVFLYEVSFYKDNIISIFTVWHGGFASFGGFAGAAVVLWWWHKKYGKKVLSYAEALAFAMPAAWMLGRVGCFLIHDHPGVCTNFALGMDNPSGCARHDLGMYESMQMAVIALMFLILYKKYPKAPQGLYMSLLLVLYSIPRFFLDYLRIWEGPLAESRYLALTPAQYGSIILLIVGVHQLAKLRRR